MTTTDQLLDLRQDHAGRFHFFPYTPGVPGGRATALALCGATRHGMRGTAWFPVGDPRGQVHYQRACDCCRGKLAI